jgi:hypothetical protein
MARKAKFKHGNSVTYNGWLMSVMKDQYVYRGNQVVDIKDGEVTHLKVPVKNVQHYEIEAETAPEEVYENTKQVVEQVSINKYQRTICVAGTTNSLTVDVYDVLEAFKVTCPALQHLAKKALCVGIRGHKDTEQDLKDIIASAQRALQLHYNRMGI